ncbi:polysaccharide biosynthesis protein [Oceaniovalibus guishaninsula JLT2003]|uniref:Polysaccharide biosynthesis protein n=1 Tax=Oceaniovalibus guishaninsula JLT2003 TaxID=1231392 RepID=K2GKK7_9RHOB|nr:polysaccharide biosynthesis/export family protein [Oceaniovalibus guishaninsula]EKE43301.1 polysaccharide biosynthesis protein [Oceaniovalibus guishaninsula JLT2003]
MTHSHPIRTFRFAAVPPALFALLAAFLLMLPAPLAAQNAYRIGPGDVLKIEVIEDSTLNRSVLVTPDGQFTFPLAGAIQAGGRTLGAVQSDLVQQLSPSFSNPPTVFVSLERLAAPPLDLPEEADTITVFVLGEAAKSGRLELEPGTTLLQAFAEMGGFSDFAALKRVQLRRKDPATGIERVYALNYNAIMQGRSPNGSVTMQDGDVILVPTRRLFE